jgi:predicted GH43/DUF377 family glycosyl hydrolase
MKHFSTIFVFVLILTFSISFAQVNWIKQGSVLDPGPAGEWDDNSLTPFCIIFDDTLYRFWYGGHDGSIWRFGYATSDDGLNWIKHNDPATTDPPYAQSDPVLIPGSEGEWDDERIVTPYVLYHDNVYKMWFSGYDGSTSRIGYASSVDGIIWTKYENNPVKDVGPVGSWNAGGVSQPCVYFDGDIFHLWYGGWDAEEYTSIGYATSPDGITWTDHEKNPILVRGYNTWDSMQVESPDVLFDGTTYHMWYHGRNTPAWFSYSIGYATAPYPDSTWEKDPNNPVLSKSAGEWDSQYVGFPRVMLADSVFTMWYLGGAADYDGHIGYARAPLEPAGIVDEEIDTPRKFVLYQNYPNPFNPSTTIEFTLPKSEFVELKVYNILGKEVLTLVSKKLNQGNHTYTFDGNNLSSGIYYYQLVAGEYREVKKMVLLR